MVKFMPKPENDFCEFIELYYNECRKRFPKIEALTGKWRFEDLVPGLSDFDGRFICSNDMTDDDWCSMSFAIGKVHLELCRRYPKWHRILEHLPSIAVTWDEFADESLFLPEYLQWSFYHCSNDKEMEKAQNVLKMHVWDYRDEYYHIKRFLNFYGLYIRDIDPAINLGPYEDKYFLHSRLMHYFTPPIQAAVSIILKDTIKGKKEALRLASNIFSGVTMFGETLGIIDKHYEVPALYVNPGMSALEERLFNALCIVKSKMSESITLTFKNEGEDVLDWKHAIANYNMPVKFTIFDSMKFSRLNKGRLYFYVNTPDNFQNMWLIRNELKRMGIMYRIPYRVCLKLIKEEDVGNPDSFINEFVPHILTVKEAAATLEFSKLTTGTWRIGEEIDTLNKIIDVHDDFFKGLNKVIRAALTNTNQG